LFGFDGVVGDDLCDLFFVVFFGDVVDYFVVMVFVEVDVEVWY